MNFFECAILVILALGIYTRAHPPTQQRGVGDPLVATWDYGEFGPSGPGVEQMLYATETAEAGQGGF